MGFSWLLSTLFIETESLNWSQSSLVLAGFTNQLASGTLSLLRKCWVYRQATCLCGTSMDSGDLPSRSSARTASASSAEPSPQPYPVFYSRHFLPWGLHRLCQNWGWRPENLLHPNYFLMFLIVSYNHTKVIDLGSIWKLLSFLRGRNWPFPNQYLLLWPGCCSAYIFGRLKIIPHQEVLSTWPSPLLWRCAHSSNLHREQQIKWRDTAVRVIFPSESIFSSIKADWEFPSCGSHGCRSATPLSSQSPSHHQSLKDKRVRDAIVATRCSLPSPAF